jgi:hypothetical protein
VKLNGMFFVMRVTGFLISIAGDRELTVDDFHKAIIHVTNYIDPDGDGVVLEMADAATLEVLTDFVKAVTAVTQDGELSVADLHKILDKTNESYIANAGKQLSFKF